MFKNKFLRISLVLLLTTFSSCNEYLDIVPDNIATIEYAFRLRTTAEQYLFTCYSYVPYSAGWAKNAGLFAGDELWALSSNELDDIQIARGFQNVVDPYNDYWAGDNSAKDLYEAIRQCNIFLENVNDVPDMEDVEKDRWIAEVKFLKAYYHFYLFRQYGPIVLVKENLEVSTSTEDVQVPRSPVDDCVDYIVELLDEAYEGLPDYISDELSELGRITKAICVSLKGIVLTTAASPFFNGNTDYADFQNNDGTPLFNTTEDQSKWEEAAKVLKEAIDYCESVGNTLYYFEPELDYGLSDSTMVKMNIRNAFCEKWNSEIIWGNSNAVFGSNQLYAIPYGLDQSNPTNMNVMGRYGPPLKIVEMFYSVNGVPITEDVTWDYSSRFELRTAGEEEKYNLKEGYTTVQLHFEREPRFYASLGFDGATWYGQGYYDDDDDDLPYVSCKAEDFVGTAFGSSHSPTGYWPKKLVNYETTIGASKTYTVQSYPWPEIRLTDLYLLYAEALNEVSGPVDEVFYYLDLIRARAGIPPIKEAWANYSKNPTKYTTQDGMREIIHTESSIELAFEGKRFWNVLRWKEAISEFNTSITGWNRDQESEEGYYKETLIYNRSFSTRDYLWPIQESITYKNTNLVQNPGW